MFGLGPTELIIILVIVIIVFGVGKLPELGTGLGEGIKNFKKSYRDAKSIDVSPESVDEAPEKEAPEKAPPGKASEKAEEKK